MKDIALSSKDQNSVFKISKEIVSNSKLPVPPTPQFEPNGPQIVMTAGDIATMICKAMVLSPCQNSSDFSNLYESMGRLANQEKFKCFWQYLTQILEMDPNELTRNVAFNLRGLDSKKIKELKKGIYASNNKISQLSFTASNIEDVEEDCIMV